MAGKQKSNSALGKGMGALLGSGSGPIGADTNNAFQAKTGTNLSAPTASTITVPVSKVVPNKDQPRKIFKDKELAELSDSIKENGIIQPITVEPIDGGKFSIIAGERRYRAAKLAGLEAVPVIIKKVTKKDSLVMAIIENVQRSDLNCIEEALAYYQLMTEFELTQDEVAKKIGKERSTIANFLRLIKLPREVVQMLQKDELSFGHGKLLAGIKEDELAKRLARATVADNLSVRDLEKLIKTSRTTKKGTDKKQNKFFNERLDHLRQKLERRTGFHFNLKSKADDSGEVVIKFSNEAEFNDIYEFLVSK